MFPNKPIESKPAVFVEYDPKTVHERLQNFAKLELTERYKAGKAESHTQNICASFWKSCTNSNSPSWILCSSRW